MHGEVYREEKKKAKEDLGFQTVLLTRRTKLPNNRKYADRITEQETGRL